MQQKDDNNKDLIDNIKTPAEKKAEDIEFWRNEHGHPSYKFLQSLADDGSPRALEKIKSIATDLNANFDSNTSVEELIRLIRSATRSGPNTTT
ncbi:gamma-glutamylcyclotransferase [bacterium]|nr:gamma-glutamylcyclotransferase [bacterium]